MNAKPAQGTRKYAQGVLKSTSTGMRSLPLIQCRNCGMVGIHRTPAECIFALRREIPGPSGQPAPNNPCVRCGTAGPHARTADCIDALRDLTASVSIRAPQRTSTRRSNRGGRRDRRDNRFVVLNGERLNLTEAALRLGLSASALHWRIVSRVGDPDYRETDLDAIRVHIKHSSKECGQIGAAVRGLRLVVLDGERMCLAAAARLIGVSRDTLDNRIKQRLRTEGYGEVDIRAIGADVKHVPMRSSGETAGGARLTGEV